MTRIKAIFHPRHPCNPRLKLIWMSFLDSALRSERQMWLGKGIPLPMRFISALLSSILSTVVFAQTPPAPKTIPPPGLTLTDAERGELSAGAAALRRDIDSLGATLASDPKLL